MNGSLVGSVAIMLENYTLNKSVNGVGVPPSSAATEALIVIVLSAMFCVVELCGIIGNVCVILAVTFDVGMRASGTNLLLVNLALADVIIMLLGVPEISLFMLGRGWLLGTALCKLNRYLLVTSLYASILSLVAVCIER